MTTITLRSGTLHIDVDRADMPLDELCGFASRRSRKRGFVFVSKVLGKHYPVRPSVMSQVHARMAARLLDLPGPVLFLGMAETATALGHGVYEQWLQCNGRDDALFQHTTRYRLAAPSLLEFEESHSHATAHLLYRPTDANHAETFMRARSLVLIDDELTTGRTLANLAAAYRRVNDRLASVHVVCLTDWLDAVHRAQMATTIGVPMSIHSLLAGRFRFEENPAFDPGPIPDVVGRDDHKDWCLPHNFGRLGVGGPLTFDLDAMIRGAEVAPGQKVLVLGTGEFAYPPFLLARRLEERGWDVMFQATTRSPLLVDGDIESAVEIVDNYHDNIPNYVYNVLDRRYDRILVGYETWPLPAAHTLLEKIGVAPVFFGCAV
jgi:hypothetical protein